MAKEIKSSHLHLPAAQQQQLEGASYKPRTMLRQLRAEEMKRSPEKDINECAEDFISKFRQNLRLQRLQSIENYREMLARGL